MGRFGGLGAAPCLPRCSFLVPCITGLLVLGLFACSAGGGGEDGFTVGGSVSGLDGTLVLQNNGGDDVTLTQDGAFLFPTGLADGDAYAVTIESAPSGQTCSISNASGTIAAADVTDVSVSCATVNVSARGAVQKGPFRSGSSVTIVELNDQLESSGTQFTTSTTDNLGHFSTTAAIDAPYVEIATQGFFFDEIGNGLSNAQITLRTVSAYVQGETVNVNILTQLASPRVERLLESGAATDFETALAQAKGEVLGLFGIPEGDIPDFDTLDLTGTGEANAILIAASALLVQVATTENPDNMAGQLSELISDIGQDFAADGVLNDPDIIAAVAQASIDLDVAAVRENLEAEYFDLGETITAASFEDYIDRDGDGVLPIEGDDNTPDGPLTLAVVSDVFPTTVHTSSTLTITGIDGNVRVELTGGTLLWNDADDDPDMGFQVVTPNANGVALLLAQENDQLQVQVTAGDYGQTATGALTIGDTEVDYQVAACTAAVCYAEGIFVSTTGNDGNLGTQTAPLLTIQAAIDKAAAIPFSSGALQTGTGSYPPVHVSAGTYEVSTPIVMADGVSVFGGYDVNFSTRVAPSLFEPNAVYDTMLQGTATSGGTTSAPNAVVSGGTGISPATVLDGFFVLGGSGTVVAAVSVIDSSPTISNNLLFAGEATDSWGVFVDSTGAAAAPAITSNFIASIGTATRAAGVYIVGGSPTISGNVFGIGAAGDANPGNTDAVGISVGPGTTATVTNNQILAVGAAGTGPICKGIDVQPGANATITTGNDINISSQGSCSPGDNYGIYINNASATISGNTQIKVGDSDSSYDNAAIWIFGIGSSHSVTVSNNAAISGGAGDSAIGIRLGTINGTVSISGNTITGGDSGVNGYGLYATFANNTSITGNSINGGTSLVGDSYGIYGDSSPGLNISNNTINGGISSGGGTVYGIQLDGSTDASISGNAIRAGIVSSGDTFGIYVGNSSTDAQITGNGIDATGNTGTVETGVLITGSSGTTLSGNTIAGGNKGIWVASGGTTIRGNTVTMIASNSVTYSVFVSNAGTGLVEISGNTVYGGNPSGTSNGIRVEDGDVDIFNNTIHGGSGSSVASGFSTGSGGYNDTANIFNNSLTTGSSSAGRGMTLNISGSGTVNIKNNIVFSVTTNCIYDVGSDPTTFQNNSLSGCGSSAAYYENGGACTGNNDGDADDTTCDVDDLNGLTWASGNFSDAPALEDDSDFNKASLSYTGGTSDFVSTNSLTGSLSGAKATIQAITGNTDTGTLTLADVTGVFQLGESLTGGGGGAAHAGGTAAFEDIWQLDDSDCANPPFFDSGQDLEAEGGFNTDKDGTTRKSSGGWSPGAYEMESDPGPGCQ